MKTYENERFLFYTMKELEYPLDCEYILQKKRAIKKELLKSKELIEKKVAIMSGSTIGEIKNILEIFLLYNGIKPQFFIGDYSLFYENLVFENSELKQFNPDIIYIHTSNKNIQNFPQVNDTEEMVNSKLNDEFERYKNVWEASKIYNCPVVQNNFELPNYRLLGNADCVNPVGKINFINKLNNLFSDYSLQNSFLHIQDINYLSTRFGLDNWCSDNIWYLYKYSLKPEMIPHLCQNLSFIIKSLLGKNKKSLILDLDNTLWGGIIGDDGADKIEIGLETPTAMAYLEFCNYVKSLSSIGIMLNVASKNEENIALAGFDLPQMPLKKSDFINFKANWLPKHENINEIIEDINILPEAFVFMDDNPAEREIVKTNIPKICVPNIENPEEYIKFIDRNGYFEITSLSNDDKKRNEMYKQNADRKKEQKTFVNYDDYLKSLEMTAVCGAFDLENSARITQLINKTNQFNLTTKRYTETEVLSLIDNPNYITIYGKLTDKFGDNGLVTAVIGEIKNNELFLDLWIMSCRTFKRNLEYLMADEIINECKKRNITTIYGTYLPTTKNLLVENFYGTIGFEVTRKSPDKTTFVLKIPQAWENKNNVIYLINKED